MELNDFHTACVVGNLDTIKGCINSGIIPRLYEELKENNQLELKRNSIANGLFWAVLCGKFDIAKYLIENKVFDPDEFICREIHILHVLAVMGGCNHSVNLKEEDKVTTHYYRPDLFRSLFQNFYSNSFEYEDNEYWYVPDFHPEIYDIAEEDTLLKKGISYDETQVLEFTKWLLENYDMNVSVRTQKSIVDYLRHSSIWLSYMDKHIKRLTYDLDIDYNCTSMTPVEYACLFGTKDMVKLFIENGCDILCYEHSQTKICKDCPYNVIKFYKSHLDVSSYFNTQYKIYYYTDALVKYGFIFQSELIETYLKEDVLYILLEELTGLRPASLETFALETTSEAIKDGYYEDDMKKIPLRIKSNLDLYDMIKNHYC